MHAQVPPNGEKEGVEADSPDEALKWRRLAWVDEHGRIPKDGVRLAEAQMAKLAANSMSTEGFAGPLWESVGPRNVAGRSRSLLIHPLEPNRMWMGSVSGGIWKTENSGATWKPVDDRLPSLAIGCMAMDPQDPNVMYAGTGEGFYNADGIFGQGILRSVDGGDTWNLLSSTTGFGETNRIAVAPDDSKLLLAATTAGGVYRSVDAGETWTNVIQGWMALQVAFDPSDGTKAVAVVRDNQGSSHGFVTRDGGKTWSLTALWGGGFFGRIELAYAPSNTKIVYASAGPDGRIYKSIDGGVNYFLMGQGPLGGGQWWYDDAVWVDPTDARHVLVGGIHVYESLDGGSTFTQKSSGYIMTDQVHPDVHFITNAPGFGLANKRVYVCTDGGLFVANDITKADTSTGWKQLPIEARTTQYYGAAGEAVTGRIVGGTQDNGTLVLNRGSANAGMMFGGDGGFSCISPLNPNYLYGEYVNLTVHRSTDGGQSAGFIYDGIADAGDGSRANFIAPIALDLGDPKILYAGGRSLWRTKHATSETVDWSEIKLAMQIGTNPDRFDTISAICVTQDHSNDVWVGYNSGRIYKSLNATWDGPNWYTIDNNGDDQNPTDPAGQLNPLPDRYVTRILVDPTDENTVYVTFGGFSPDNLWVTHDGGTSWNPCVGSGDTALPSAPIRAICFGPLGTKTIVVGTEVGVCISKNAGKTWSTPAFGPANVSIDEINRYQHSNKLLVTTHGRGLWLYGPTQPVWIKTPGSMFSGTQGTCTLYLDGNAPAGGYTIPLTYTNTHLAGPSSVVVKEGTSSVDFTVSTDQVESDTYAYVVATLNNGTKKGQVLIHRGPGTLSMSVSPTEVFGGTTLPVKITVTTATEAPTGGWTINLASLDPSVATTAASVKIPMGKTSATVGVKTKPVAATSIARFTGSILSLTAQTSLKVYPAPQVTLSPSQVVGGSATAVTGTLTLPFTAPTGGMTFSLSTSDPSLATTPATVTVPGGQTQRTFAVTHFAVGTKTAVFVTATAEGVKCSAKLILWPPIPTLTLAPTTVVGGSGDTVVGTVEISVAAPASGVPVKLSSTDPGHASVPAFITVPSGKKVQTFVVTHQEVTVKTSVTIKASTGAVSKAVLTLIPPPAPVGLVAKPNPVRGGSTKIVTGTVTLAFAAPKGGTVVKLASFDGSLVDVPATVTVAAGSTTGQFTIEHHTVAQKTTVAFSATTGIKSKLAWLTLLPPALVSFKVSPTSITGGDTATGTVAISGPAPDGGALVTITVDKPGVVAPPPPTAGFIEPGQSKAYFFLQSSKVTAVTNVTITASYGGVTKTQVLQVTP